MAFPLPSPRLLAAPAFALLVSCAAQGSFPSLAPRPIERALAEETLRTPSETIAADADAKLVEQVAGFVAEARGGQSAFAAALPGARASAAASGDAGSENWIEAQQAISRLESARAPTVAALAELDRLAVVRVGTADMAPIIAALDQVRAIADDQERQIGLLRESLSPL